MVTSVPRLFGRGVLYATTTALWRVTLNGTVSAERHDGKPVQTQMLFVSSEAATRF
jgi:hypothetical protein